MNAALLIPLLLVGGVVIIAIALIAVGFSNANQTDPLAERLAEYSAAEELTANLEDIEMSVPFSQRVLLPIMQAIARFTTQFTPQEALERTQHLLDLAGNPSGLTPSILWAARFLMLLFLAPLLFAMLRQRGLGFAIGGGLAGAAVGFMMPAMYIQSKATRRQQEIIKSLPDALDLMSICVEAGLGFDQAMSRVADKWDNELSIAFGRVIREIQVGKTRREALKAMDESMDVPDVRSFVAAIVQADQLGVSISRVLKIQAEQMRIKRRQRAEEKAQQAPIKMMIPMALLIFPSIYLVILGPATIQLYKVFYE